MKFVSAAFATVFFAAAFSSTPSQAAPMTATFTGTVASGLDGAGIFSTSGADLTGLGYTSVFHYDPSLGLSISNSLYLQQFGGTGTGYPASSPLLSASITIGGHTYSIGGAFLGDLSVQAPPNSAFHVEMQNRNTVGSHTIRTDLTDNAFAASVPFSLTVPFSANLSLQAGGFSYQDYSSQATVITGLSLTSTHVDVVSYVPEPITLSLFGVGVAGSIAMRRRKKPGTANP